MIPAQRQRQPRPASGIRAFCLVVDDDPDDEAALVGVLSRRLPYVVVETFRSPFPALQRMARHPFDLVISDLHLPDMSGTKFLAEVARVQPDAFRILVTGEGGMAATEPSSSADLVLLKPIATDPFAERLADILFTRQQKGKRQA